jgi:hypothetical protein
MTPADPMRSAMRTASGQWVTLSQIYETHGSQDVSIVQMHTLLERMVMVQMLESKRDAGRTMYRTRDA